jgi:predicted transcriptional regulator of viral defense system
MMILRGFYRSVELAQGWTGYLITHEAYIIGLDAVPMVIAMGTLAVLSPGSLLVKARRSNVNDPEKAQQAVQEPLAMTASTSDSGAEEEKEKASI